MSDVTEASVECHEYCIDHDAVVEPTFWTASDPMDVIDLGSSTFHAL